MPTRSASHSLSRVKLIWCCTASPWAATMRAFGGLAAAGERAEQDGADHGGRGGQALLRLVGEHARDVVLRDVRGLVRHDARELRLGRRWRGSVPALMNT